MTQIPDKAVMALEALKKAEMFIENGVEYGFIRLPEKDDPALDTLPKIKAAIEALTNDGAMPVDVAAVRGQAFEEAANICAEYAKSFQEGLCHYGDADKDGGRGRQEGHIDAGNELASAISALSAAPTTEAE